MITEWINKNEITAISGNRELNACLLGLKYGVLKIKGVFWENSEESILEVNSFLVVNLNNDPNFYENIFKLGAYYNQDSILWKPKESLEGYRVGTNDHPRPGYGNREKSADYISNIENELMSRVGNKGIDFNVEEVTIPESQQSFNDKRMLRKIRQKKRAVNKVIIDSFDLFWRQQNATKYLIMKECSPIIKTLSLENSGVEIHNDNYERIIHKLIIAT